MFTLAQHILHHSILGVSSGGGGGGSVATDSIWDTLGDIAVGTGADTAAVLPVTGIANGWVLTRDSGATLGVKWAAASGGGGSIDGSGTATHLARWIDSDTLGNSLATDDTFDFTVFAASTVNDGGSQLILLQGTSGVGGVASLYGGAGLASGHDGGDVLLGGGPGGSSGDIAGSVTLQGGAAGADTSGGTVRAIGSGGFSGGGVELQAGQAASGGFNGSISIQAGFNSDSDGGSVSITSGIGGSTVGSGGTFLMASGNGSSTGIGNGGSYTMSAGAGGGTSGDGGGFTMSAGSASADGAGGAFNLTAGFGAGATGQGGSVFVEAGTSADVFTGGRIEFKAGSGGTTGSVGAKGGQVDFHGGAGGAGNGFGSGGGDGGDIVFHAGSNALSDGGAYGKFRFIPAGSSNTELDFNAITGDRVVTFPDADLDFQNAYSGNFTVLTALPSTFATVTVANGIIVSVV